MKKIYLVVITSLLAATLHAQNSRLEWANGVIGKTSAAGLSINTDPSGNVYTVGIFGDTLDFDPGAGIFNIGSKGGNDIFIQKLDSNGNFVWAVAFGGKSSERSFGATLDPWGNVLITGTYRDTADFDPGAGVFNLMSNGNSEIFVVKLDTVGNFVWAKSMGSGSADYGKSITTDGAGSVYVTGWFEDTVDFDPGAGIFNIASNGKQDIFIQKLNAGGNFIWAKSIGGSLTDVGRSITTDIFGDILLTGNFRGVVDFDPDTSVFDVSSLGSEAIFIMKLDTAGNLIWAKPTPGNLYSRGYSIATDPLGNVCVTGWYWGKVDFDPGAAYYYMTSKGYDDIFVLKLDVGGNFIWAKSMGSTFPAQVGESITVDTAGNVYTTGYFRGNVDFDPGASTTYIWSNGINDIFIHKLDSGGNFIWVKTMGSSSFDEGRSITSDASGKVYVTGSYRSTVDFDASAATYKLTGSSTGSSFTLKLGPCITYRGIDTLNVCDSLTWIDGNTYFSNNSTDSFLLVAGALNGCDSLVTLNLTLRYSNGNTDVISACDSITWIDGNSYTSSNNTATYSYTNAVGCDSVITLNLTINNNTGIDVISTCNPYKWIDGITYSSTNFTATHTLTNASGCDSVITLNLTINNNTGIDIIWTCNPYKWIDGITYSSTNFTATHTLTNASGCDSVVTLNLTIVIVDVNVSSTATLIIANAIGATYQWLDCNNNYAMLSGKTGKTFSPGMNGDYAVEVAENRCVDTSECTNISALNIKENTLFNNVSIFPNPNSGLVKIELGNLRDVSVKVFTETGQLIYQEEEINTSIYQFELEVAAGVYFLELNAQGEKRRYKLVKE